MTNGLERTTLLLLLLVANFFVVPATAETRESGNRAGLERVKVLVEATGMDTVFLTIKDQFELAIVEQQQQVDKPPEKYLEAVRESMSNSYDPEKMIGRFIELMNEKSTKEEVEAGIAFYQSEFGRRVVELEITAQSPQFAKTIQQSLSEIEKKLEESPAHKTIILQIMEDIAATDSAMALLSNMLYSMFAGMVAADQTPQALSDAQIFAIVNQQMVQMRPQVERTMIATMFVAYQSLSIEELEGYAKAIALKDINKLYANYIDSLTQVIGEHSKNYGTLIFEAMGKEKI